ncbi:hypothetical protein [Limnovirga soli]|uniref:Uncharacterized protein n=1 Tax=Limnovirga soli TaxID=2656915 RepID=A0A8J8FMU1_9BACT|nr:hypothetical protein [Limnovirga soli]NNV57759.1 hypothetical protein [Limnovirga soli]
MQFFLDFIRENERIKRLFNIVAETPGHQGTVIRFSNNFFSIYEIHKRYPSDIFKDIIYRFFDFHRHFFRELPDGIFFQFPFQSDSEYTIPNISTFRDFERFKESLPLMFKEFNFRPLEVIISVFNDAKIELFEEIIYQFRDDENFRVLIERRGRNIFLNSQKVHNPLVGGVSISSNNEKSFGTLGGFLNDKNGNVYGLTCAHVVSSNNQSVFQPAKYDSSKSREIGKVLFSSDLNFCPFQSPCSPESSIGNMDVTLIQIDNSENCEFRIHELGKINKLKEFKDINQGMKVEFNGRTTNERKQLIIGGLCVSYKIAYEQDSISQYACFTNLIELRSIPFKILGTEQYANALPVRAGDSGAWICSNDSEGYSWCGMLISGDVDRGYFLSSEHIIKWLDKSGYSFDL